MFNKIIQKVSKYYVYNNKQAKDIFVKLNLIIHNSFLVVYKVFPRKYIINIRMVVTKEHKFPLAGG